MAASRLSLITCLLLTTALWACAKPQTRTPVGSSYSIEQEASRQVEFVLEQTLSQQSRLWNVAYPLLLDGAELCGDKVQPRYGFWAWTKWNFDSPYRAAAMRLYGLDNQLRVVHIVPGSPAAEAGLYAGDLILGVGAHQIPTGERANDRMTAVLETVTKLDFATEFHVSWNQTDMTIAITPRPACDYPLIMTDDDAVNAFADGRNIFVTRGLLRFTDSNQHLAFIVGHELAHNAMEHRDAKEQNMMVGALGGMLLDIGFLALGVNTGGAFIRDAGEAGARVYSVEFEQEADYVGLYFLARAGYELKGASDFWRLMAARNPRMVSISNTHPTSPERFVAMEQAIMEIDQKMASGRPLVPEYRTP